MIFSPMFIILVTGRFHLQKSREIKSEFSVCVHDTNFLWLFFHWLFMFYPMTFYSLTFLPVALFSCSLLAATLWFAEKKSRLLQDFLRLCIISDFFLRMLFPWLYFQRLCFLRLSFIDSIQQGRPFYLYPTVLWWPLNQISSVNFISLSSRYLEVRLNV